MDNYNRSKSIGLVSIFLVSLFASMVMVPSVSAVNDTTNGVITGTETWTGTMNLTEPQSGTDLGAIRTSSIRDGDRYLIKGQKIYITWGDHDMTDNIVHLVLARSPDGPPGTRGLSLFIVPKFLVNSDGTLGQRNDVRPVSLEHKIGIHASPTCVMSYGENEGAKALKNDIERTYSWKAEIPQLYSIEEIV